MLIFGTDEGRLGIIDALSPRPTPTIFDFKHRASVYNLTYGPTINIDGSTDSTGTEMDSTSLYSLGDGVIFMHKAEIYIMEFCQFKNQ